MHSVRMVDSATYEMPDAASLRRYTSQTVVVTACPPMLMLNVETYVVTCSASTDCVACCAASEIQADGRSTVEAVVYSKLVLVQDVGLAISTGAQYVVVMLPLVSLRAGVGPHGSRPLRVQTAALGA